MKNKKTIIIILSIIFISILSVSSVTFNSNKHERYFEEQIVVEKWMTKPFTDTVEEPLELEEWMTKPFTNLIKK